nr:Chain B, Mad2-binding peptide [synthetic construct]2QYF_E Chain E, peptide [synthetic construct]2QYF_F Chain F, peptide [synthetic construct]2V64_B Chain B, MBP1 [synthetic construct]2V64_G Chain G, MBP1 [synthetic construct]2V64_I Chain I, MBP1 [synthetic construct]
SWYSYPPPQRAV